MAPQPAVDHRSGAVLWCFEPIRATPPSLRRWRKEHRIKAVIPSSANRTVPYPLDRTAYRRRNLIERLFCRLKNWRRMAVLRTGGPRQTEATHDSVTEADDPALHIRHSRLHWSEDGFVANPGRRCERDSRLVVRSSGEQIKLLRQ
jgi:transposase